MRSDGVVARSLERKVSEVCCWLLCRSTRLRDSPPIPLSNGLHKWQVLRLARRHWLCSFHQEHIHELMQLRWESRGHEGTLTAWCLTRLKKAVQEYVRGHWRSQVEFQQGQGAHRKPGTRRSKASSLEDGILWARALSQSWATYPQCEMQQRKPRRNWNAAILKKSVIIEREINH